MAGEAAAAAVLCLLASDGLALRLQIFGQGLHHRRIGHPDDTQCRLFDRPPKRLGERCDYLVEASQHGIAETEFEQDQGEHLRAAERAGEWH